MDADCIAYVMSVVAARCPEVVDEVVPVEILLHVVGIVDALAERVAALAQAVDGPDEIEGIPRPPPPKRPLASFLGPPEACPRRRLLSASA